jgi:hypothetical protein
MLDIQTPQLERTKGCVRGNLQSADEPCRKMATLICEVRYPRGSAGPPSRGEGERVRVAGTLGTPLGLLVRGVAPRYNNVLELPKGDGIVHSSI